LIVPNKGASAVLKAQANAILEWRYDVLVQDVGPALDISPQSQDSGNSLGKSSDRYPSRDVLAGGRDPLSNVKEMPASNMNGSRDNVSLIGKLTKDDSKTKLKIATTATIEDDVDPQRFLLSPMAPGYFDLLVEVLHWFKLSGGIFL
jgi:hypothetical protein